MICQKNLCSTFFLPLKLKESMNNYCPTMKLREGNVFSRMSVCVSLHSGCPIIQGPTPLYRACPLPWTCSYLFVQLGPHRTGTTPPPRNMFKLSRHTMFGNMSCPITPRLIYQNTKGILNVSSLLATCIKNVLLVMLQPPLCNYNVDLN